MKETKMKLVVIVMVAAAVLSSPLWADTHRNVQAVDADGYGTHPDLQTTNKVTVEGVVLNRPDYMLDSTPAYDNGEAGGMWQIFIQGDVYDDHAGTVVWMAQNYDNLWGGTGMYNDPCWTYELYRLSHDPGTAFAIQPGDKVKVTGLLKFYAGKTNINERHNTDSNNDVTIELVEANVGIPQPEVVALSELKDGSDSFIFDPCRLAGCEYYQGRLIRINDVSIVSCANWGPDDPGDFQTLTIQDTTGRTFPLKLGLGPGFSQFSCPSGEIDVIGILDQESSSDPKVGYRIWVTNYDGNGSVLTDFGLPQNHLPGDVNLDGTVDLLDFTEFANHWLAEHPEGT